MILQRNIVFIWRIFFWRISHQNGTFFCDVCSKMCSRRNWTQIGCRVIAPMRLVMCAVRVAIFSANLGQRFVPHILELSSLDRVQTDSENWCAPHRSRAFLKAFLPKKIPSCVRTQIAANVSDEKKWYSFPKYGQQLSDFRMVAIKMVVTRTTIGLF